MSPFLATLDRLESILDETIGAMSERKRVDHERVTAAKGRALLALTRLAGTHPASSHDAPTRELVNRVREKLAKERDMIEARLHASQLVVTLISNAMIAADWDGTYGPMPQRFAAPARPNTGIGDTER